MKLNRNRFSLLFFYFVISVHSFSFSVFLSDSFFHLVLLSFIFASTNSHLLIKSRNYANGKIAIAQNVCGRKVIAVFFSLSLLLYFSQSRLFYSLYTYVLVLSIERNDGICNSFDRKVKISRFSVMYLCTWIANFAVDLIRSFSFVLLECFFVDEVKY